MIPEVVVEQILELVSTSILKNIILMSNGGHQDAY